MLDPNENILADIPHEVDNMRLVAKIDNEETKNILNCIMLCYMDHDGDDYFYVFTKEQIEYFLYLFEVAKSLDKNETFNPNGIKYFVKFRNNDAVKTIRKEIEKYYSLLNNSNEMIL